jgi:hypothetical protein
MILAGFTQVTDVSTMKQFRCPVCGQTRFFDATMWAAYTNVPNSLSYNWPSCDLDYTPLVNTDGNSGGVTGDGA